jgi:glucosylglycerol-phosphate synthase
VLSEFAGAAVQLDAAVMANPYSHRSMDGSLLTALDMDPEDRRARMEILRKAVEADQIAGWGALQMGAENPLAA